MILQWAAEGKTSLQICQDRKEYAYLTLGILPPLELRLAFWMKAFVTLAHRPAGLALRENVLNLRFAACEVAVCWFP